MDNLKAIFFAIAFIPPNLHAENLSLEQVLQSVIDNYPSIPIAALQVNKVEQNSVRALSRLGWRLSAQAGRSKEVDFAGGKSSASKVRCWSGENLRLREYHFTTHPIHLGEGGAPL